MGLDGRPSAIHITLQSQVIGLALILLAAARDWDSFDTSNELSYIFVLGLGGLLAGAARARAVHAPRRARGAADGLVEPQEALFAQESVVHHP
jgi:uncharacterized membrane protein